MLRALKRNPMARTFLELKGNARTCIWTEPLWGIPYNLYVPYATLYMAALGLSAAEIGYIASIVLAVQVISSVLSGVLTDKMGRRMCTLVFDVLSWSVPELIWAFSQSYPWFVAAALFNGFLQMTVTSWGLLWVEGTEEDLVVRGFSLTQLMGLMAAFIAPLSKFAIDAFSLVPTMRVLYLITCALMTTKFVVLFLFTKETDMGLKRMAETRDQSVLSLLIGCWGVFLQIIREKRMLLTIALMSVFNVVRTLNGNFWALFAHNRLGVAESDVSLFSTCRSVVMLIVILAVVPRLRFRRFRPPMLLSWALFAAAQAILLLTPYGRFSAPLLVLSVSLEAFALAVLNPLIDSLLFVNAEPVERARILGLIYGAMLIPVTVFPAVAGRLAVVTIAAPFAINLVLLAVGAWLTLKIDAETNKTQQKEASQHGVS